MEIERDINKLREEKEKPKGKNEKYCINCGKKIDKKAEICPKCGVRILQPILNNPKNYMQIKNSGLAVMLSFFFPGFGQIYNGQIIKGILFMFILTVNLVFTLREVKAFIFSARWIIAIGFIIWIIIWIGCMYDAHITAENINNDYLSKNYLE